MNEKEILFLYIFYCNINFLIMLYLIFCYYYRIRLDDFFLDIILLGAGLISLFMYAKATDHRSLRLLSYP